MSNRYALRMMLGIALVAVVGSPAAAQGKAKTKAPPSPKVTVDAALSVTKDVLVQQGFEVLRVEVEQERHVVYYRAGNRGRGKGHGPPMRMVIRRVEERIVLEEAPDDLRLEIGIKLGIKL